MDIKSTWHRVTREDVLREFEYIVQKAHSEGLFRANYGQYRCRGLYATNRRTRNIATCYHNHLLGEWCVVLNNNLLQCSMDKIRATLVHEIAHACCPTDHHGAIWHYIANRLGNEWGYNASRLTRDEEIIQTCCKYKPRIYAVKCPHCGAIWRRKVQCRLIKYPQLYTCVKCNCTLERVE